MASASNRFVLWESVLRKAVTTKHNSGSFSEYLTRGSRSAQRGAKTKDFPVFFLRVSAYSV